MAFRKETPNVNLPEQHTQKNIENFTDLSLSIFTVHLETQTWTEKAQVTTVWVILDKIWTNENGIIFD